jgi:O-antigen ligase
VPTSAWERMGMVGTIGGGGTEVLGELDDSGSAEQRYRIWQTSYRIIGDHPLLGVGWGAYPFANAQYDRGVGFKDTHSTYLNLTAEAGFPGITLFAMLIVSTFIRARQARRAVAATDPAAAQQLWYLELGLIGFLVAGVFGSYAKLTVLYLHIGLIWSLAGVHLRAVQAARRHAVHARPRR